MPERLFAVCQVLVTVTLSEVSVERRSRACSTIALARLRSWKINVSPIEAPPFSSSANVASSRPVMPMVASIGCSQRCERKAHLLHCAIVYK
jgi:hypothetical protein